MGKIVGLSFLGVVVLFALWVLGHMNSVPSMQETVNGNWGQVENVYQRRMDLIPNLVESVKGYAGHENSTLKEVIAARASATQMTVPKALLTDPKLQAQALAAQDSLGQALGRLMVVVEKYPELKADKHFSELMSQFEGTENRISVERRRYVLSVQDYNTEVRTVPGRWWAAFYDAKPMDQYKAEGGVAARTAPKVSFK